jgi:hypothetical protein
MAHDETGQGVTGQVCLAFSFCLVFFFWSICINISLYIYTYTGTASDDGERRGEIRQLPQKRRGSEQG